MGSVFAGSLWVQPHWILVLYVINYWSLHCVSILESQISNENVNASRIAFIHYPCLSLMYSPIKRFDALFTAGTDDARFDRVDALQLFLDLQQAILRSSHHKVMSVRQAPFFLFLVVKQVSRTASHFITPIFEVSLSVSFLIACCISGAVHVFLQRPNLSFIFPCSIVCW